MLPDLEPTNQPATEEAEIEPIQPQEAERILADALKPYLADGWRVLNQNAYSARLTRGLRNKDFQVDLLGQIDIQESNLTPVQDSGRLTAWLFLLTFLLVAMALASALGLL